MRILLLALLVMFSITSCGGGGGGSSPGNTGNTNPASGNTGTLLFQQLDDALSQRVVSTTNPTGLWIFYGKGTASLLSSITGGSLDHNETINLFAFVASVFVDNGTLKVAANNCTADYRGNSGFPTAVANPGSFTQYTLDLKKLTQMAGTLYPFTPGDALLDANYQAYLDNDFTVTINNNSEMIFPSAFSFTDNNGNITGSISAMFKARKFSDNFNSNLGNFNVDSYMRNSHCFTYLHQYSDHTDSASSQGQTFVTESMFNSEKFSIETYPSLSEGISSFLYQGVDSFTPVINGQASTASAKSTHISLFNTSNTFTDVIATSALSAHMVDITLNFNVATGLSADYAISDGSNTLTGTVEAGY